MATCRDIIARALRKLADLDKNDNPTANDELMGMSALQTLFDGWAASGKFGALCDVYTDQEYDAHAGQRVRSAQTVNLPAYDGVTTDCCCCWDYGFWRDCCDRPVDLSLIEVVNPTTGIRSVFLWDGNVSGWVQINALDINDTCPLATRGQDDIACCLALLIADEVGLQPGALTVRRAGMFETMLATRLGSTRAPTYSEYM